MWYCSVIWWHAWIVWHCILCVDLCSMRSLVSTYVVCERLSVMHEPAGVVEILVQILQNTPILKYSFLKLSEILALWLFSFRIHPPPPENWNLGRSWHFKTFQFHNPPTHPPPPPNKIEIKADLGTLRLFSFRTTCGKLPHVETLSSPDNYSLPFVPLAKNIERGLVCLFVLAFSEDDDRNILDRRSPLRNVITVRNEVAKVMFLHLCVCPQGGLPQCMLGYHHPRSRHPPPLGADPPPGGQAAAPPPTDGYCCGRYAYYWNAFLLNYVITDDDAVNFRCGFNCGHALWDRSFCRDTFFPQRRNNNETMMSS